MAGRFGRRAWLLVAMAGVFAVDLAGPFAAAQADMPRFMTRSQRIDYDRLHMAGVQARNEQRWADALASFRQALALAERTWGDDDARIVPALNAVGVTLTDAGQAAEGETVLRRALDLRERRYKQLRTMRPEDEEGLQASLLNLAANLDRQGRHHDAEAYYRRLLNQAVEYYGQHDGKTQIMRVELARNLCRQQRPGDAEALLHLAASAGNNQSLPRRCADLPM